MRERRALRFLVEAIFLGLLAAGARRRRPRAAADRRCDAARLARRGALRVGRHARAAALRSRPAAALLRARRCRCRRRGSWSSCHRRRRVSGYPAARLDDQATWIASPAMRAELAADWPVDPPGPEPTWRTPAIDDTIVVALPPLRARGRSVPREHVGRARPDRRGSRSPLPASGRRRGAGRTRGRRRARGGDRGELPCPCVELEVGGARGGRQPVVEAPVAGGRPVARSTGRRARPEPVALPPVASTPSRNRTPEPEPEPEPEELSHTLGRRSHGEPPQRWRSGRDPSSAPRPEARGRRRGHRGGRRRRPCPP